jgi:hypothetical protein
MAFLCACVMRGGKNPLVVEVISNAAEAFGVVVPIPTWAKVVKLVATKTAENINFFMFLKLSLLCLFLLKTPC